MNNIETVISVQDVHMSYGSISVLQGISFTIARGEIVALLGPNGAGKTTTMEILEGFREPSAGVVQVLGIDPLHGGESWRSRLGVVLQSWRDHPRWRVRELVGHFGEFYRPFSTPERVRPWDVDALLQRVGLGGKGDRQVMNLSGGERRRLDVALGLVGRPELLFLDEPTSGLDPQARREMHDLLRGLADEDVTILVTTHDLDEAERTADRILVLAGKQIVADGTADRLRRELSQNAEVSWVRDGVIEVHATNDPVGFLRELLSVPGEEITDLEVRRSTLEDVYLDLVNKVEPEVQTPAKKIWEKR